MGTQWDSGEERLHLFVHENIVAFSSPRQSSVTVAKFDRAGPVQNFVTLNLPGRRLGFFEIAYELSSDKQSLLTASMTDDGNLFQVHELCIGENNFGKTKCLFETGCRDHDSFVMTMRDPYFGLITLDQMILVNWRNSTGARYRLLDPHIFGGIRDELDVSLVSILTSDLTLILYSKSTR